MDYAWRLALAGFSALDVAHQAQSFDLPTAARQSWHQPLEETATQTVPINVAPPLRDTHSSGHDAHTQTHTLSLDASLLSLFRRVPLPKMLPLSFPVQCFLAAASAPRGAPERRTLVIARMAPHLFLREQRSVPSLMCSSRFTDLLGHPPTPGLAEHSQRLPSHLIPSKAHAPTSDAQCQWSPGREHRVRPIILPLSCLMPVLPRRDNICFLPPAAGDQGLPVPYRREHNPSSATLLAPVTTNHSRSLRLRFCRWSGLPSPNPAGRAPFSTRTATSCITCTASLCSSGIRAQHANTPHKFWRRPAEDAMRSSCKKPVIMSHESRTSSLRTRAARTLPSCSTRTRSSPTLLSSPSPRPLPARTRAKWRHRWFVDCCVALSGSPTVTFCSVHVHNVVAQKRRLDLSSSTPLRSHGAAQR